VKAIKLVIGTYFVQPWPLGFLFWGGLLSYVIIFILTLSNVEFLYEKENIPLIGFALSFGFLSVFFGTNLRRAIQSPTSLLMPKYRQTQIVAVIISILILMLFPVIWLSFLGFSTMTMITTFMFIITSIIIMTYRFSEELLQIIFLLWILKMGFQTLGMNFGPRIWGLSNLEIFGSKFLYELIFLIIILSALYVFYRYYLKVSIYKEYIAKHSDDGWNRNHDTGPKWQIALVNYLKNRMVKKHKKKKNNRFYQIRLMQYSLFSPFALTVSTVLVFGFFIFIYGLTLVWQFYNFNKSGIDIINTIIHISFVIFILIQVSDFLNHRNRICLLWMQIRSSDKKSFLDSVFWVVIYNSMKYYISVSILYLLSLYALSYSSIKIIAALLLGLNFYIFVPALAFIFSDKIKSEGSNGWNMSMMFLVLFLINIGNAFIRNAGEHLPVVIVVLMITLVISFGILYLGLMKWRKTELTLPGLP